MELFTVLVKGGPEDPAGPLSLCLILPLVLPCSLLLASLCHGWVSPHIALPHLSTAVSSPPLGKFHSIPVLGFVVFYLVITFFLFVCCVLL